MANSQAAVSLQEFTLFLLQRSGQSRDKVIRSCLLKTLEIHESHRGKRVMLPSLMALAGFFEVSQILIHDVFQQLRKEGYDYVLNGLEEPIPFWYRPSDEAETL